MLKYYNIISQLSEKDKIRLLTDVSSLANKEFKVLGIPEIKIAAADNYCAERYPSAISLANSWDVNLIGEVADDIYNTMSENDIGLISVPAPKIKIDPYRPALSEDPYLSSVISREYLKAAHKASTPAALDIGTITSNETEWLDESPDERYINEFLFKPFCDAANNLPCSALFIQPDIAENRCKDINSLLTNNTHADAIAKNATVICRRASAEDTVLSIAEGKLCFEGSAPALESAIARYKHIKNAIEHGNSTIENLNTEIALGKAISPEMIDEATDRLIDFAFSVKRKPRLSEKQVPASLALSACEKSTVLLKNLSSRLPIKRGAKVCIIGDLANNVGCKGSFLSDLANGINGSEYSYIGFSRGYDINADRSEELITEAFALASQADVVLMFLGLGKARENSTVRSRKISIPANQQQLLDSLSSSNKKIVAILPPDHLPDIVLTNNCAAILLAPLETEISAQSLTNILSGKVSPSGKLASTLYTDSDDQYKQYKTRHLRDGIKCGPFIGYRYYDTSGDHQEFPFGHGLSYTHFSYSRLSVHEGKVKFFVKNDGKFAASEIAQLYIGMENPNVIMPRKELRGFIKIDLKPGEKKAVEMPLNILQIYDIQTSSFVEATGIYNIYIGASSSDIRLTSKIRAGNTAIESDGKRSVDYIQTQSNIITDNFKLEVKIKTMKKPVFNFITGSISLLLAIALKLYCISSGNDSLFFDIFSLALGFLGLILFISETIRRNKIHKTQRAAIDEATFKSFNDAEKISEYDAAAMFVKEFDSESDENVQAAIHHDEVISAEHFAYIDKSQDFASAVKDFEVFAASRGCKFSSSVVKRIFAAIASSRLIVTTGMNNSDFKSFITVLSNYFETGAFIDSVDSSYNCTERLLFKTDLSGEKHKTQAFFAAEAARTTSYNIHFAALTNVTSAELSSYFSAYIDYVKNPYGQHHVVISNEKNVDVSYYIPQNLWFVLNLAENEKPDSLPDFISELATVNVFPFTDCAQSDRYPNIKKFSYHQLELLVERIGSKFFIKEEDWKKVDKLEDYLSRGSDFEISNKTWLGLEKYASVLLASDAEAVDALDEALSAKLMIPAICAFKTSPNRFDKPMIESLEAIFGEGNTNACIKMIKNCDRV